MKTTELRIGNYIKVIGSDNIQQIDSISTYGVSAWDVPKMNGNWNYDEVNLEPIPITDKTLNIFGIYRRVRMPVIYELDTYFRLEKRTGGFFFNYGADDVDFMVRVEYIHRLQNLYFAINGEELKIKL